MILKAKSKGKRERGSEGGGGGGGKHWCLTLTPAFLPGSSAAHPAGDASAGKLEALAVPGPHGGAAVGHRHRQCAQQSYVGQACVSKGLALLQWGTTGPTQLFSLLSIRDPNDP